MSPSEKDTEATVEFYTGYDHTVSYFPSKNASNDSKHNDGVRVLGGPRKFVPFKCIRDAWKLELSREARISPRLPRQLYGGKGGSSVANSFRVMVVGISDRVVGGF
jgi:hypothetical protein